jgi:glyoxylase-like metal-dependent hydrolase (beta-lactamase superfamily II)
MKRALTLIAILCVGVLAMGVAHGQTDSAAIRIEKVKENLFIITGGRPGQSGTVSGNTTVFVAASGVVLVDTKLPGFGNALLEQVRSVTSKPVTTIINTHTHADHTGSNHEFPRTVEFVAHENTRANMLKMEMFQGDKAAFVPTRTFADRMSLLSDQDRIDLYYFGRGHTNGDTVIVLPALRVAVFGDLFARKWAPLVDAANGGSAVAYPQTVAKAIAALTGVDSVITGHATTTIRSGQGASSVVRSNPVMTKADLQEYADFLREFVTAAQAARKAGQTVDEAVKGLKLSDRFRNYDMANARADVQRVYEELP